MLKPINAFQIKLPDFEGPLDLLLYLIEREELDITRVSLARVTGAYLEYIHVLEQLQVDQVADFLVVAAKLLLIKSEALLPRPPSTQTSEEEDVGDDLVKQLLLYKQYKESARKLGDREAAGLHTYIRVAPPPKVEAKLDLSNITVDMLIKAVRSVLAIEPAGPPVGTVVKPFTLTIRDQMNLIERILRYRPNISFKRMLRRARDRVEIIVTFLAVLELLRRHKVDVVQEQLFGDILIVPLETSVPPEGAAIPDEEESAFEIPKAEAEQPPAKEFEFDQGSQDQRAVDQGSDDQELGSGKANTTGITDTAEEKPIEATTDGSIVGEDQQIPELGAAPSTGEDRPGA
ncbi:MAG TPA: segregation/condensation protein A [Anaerolineae bacterium]|nr:segregation/condensation protein A [Anaerolineae bacterium]